MIQTLTYKINRVVDRELGTGIAYRTLLIIKNTNFSYGRTCGIPVLVPVPGRSIRFYEAY
jgi:hypothetical protein